jgi:hypothetical protein
MKIHPVESQLFHVDGRADGQTVIHDEANSRLSQFCDRAYKPNRRKAVRSEKQNKIE